MSFYVSSFYPLYYDCAKMFIDILHHSFYQSFDTDLCVYPTVYLIPPFGCLWVFKNKFIYLFKKEFIIKLQTALLSVFYLKGTFQKKKKKILLVK